MANIKIIDLPTGSPESTSFVEATQVDALAESGRSTVKLALNALGNYVAGQDASPLEYGDLETESPTLIGGINELHDSIGADAYDDTATYNTGDYCIHNNTIYRCNDDNVTGAWDSSKWEAKTIVGLINEVNEKIGINTAITPSSVHSSISNDQSIFSIKGNILFFSLTFKTSSLASWSDMFIFNNLSVDTTDSPFIPLASGDDSARFRFYNDNGVLKLQNGIALSSNDFYVASGMIFVNQTN